MKNAKDSQRNRIFTIPNALSVVRLCLIPLIIWLYCVREEYPGTTLVLLISGFTDVVDGFIARKFNMVSDIGKALDPIADKATQLAMMICLLTNFPFMWIPLVLLVIKETFAGVTGLLVIKKTGNVYGAEWHGKLTTCTIYLMIVVHLIWYDIPNAVSLGFIGCTVAVMAFSCLFYGMRNIHLIKDKKEV